MDKTILDVIRERGLLLEKAVLELLENFQDSTKAKDFLVNIERISGQKYISLGLLGKNVEFVNSVVKKMPGDDREMLEKTFIKLGLSLEVRKESEVIKEDNGAKVQEYKVFYANTNPDRKLEVKDFTNHFRTRYQNLQRILMQRQELQANLVSINKISGDRQSISIIGIVIEKRITKNGNLILKIEDMTGDISGIIKSDSEYFDTAQELLLDDIVGIKGSGNRDLMFIHEIKYPDIVFKERTVFNEDINVVFLSDVHCGSDRHLGKSFGKFLDWLESDDEEAKKVKYVFFVGDNVDGVGIFPGQEDVLALKSMEEQYSLLSSYLKRVPKKITMFMCPGQHDATRVAEPQPIISKKYAEELYKIENLVLVTNPCMVNLNNGDNDFKILMYHGASMHSFVNEIKELKEIKAYKCPAKILRHMVKRRHLAPSHGNVVYIPNAEVDPMAITEVPDVLCTGEVHHLDIENYKGVKLITGSCWQATTDFEEKVGHVPDPCKVPVMNLKSGAIKVYDFSEKEEVGKWM